MNTIRLWAVALFVALGLLAMPVAVADASGKATLSAAEQIRLKGELFSAFDRAGKTEKFGNAFKKLSVENQIKVLSFFAQAKLDQLDERALLKGVYNLSLYHERLKINEDALVVYKKTGKLPDVDLPAIWGNASIVAQSSSSGPQYVNVQKAKELDELITEIMKKETAKIKKNTELMQTLLKAL